MSLNLEGRQTIKYLLMLILHSDKTLVTNVSILINPKTTQEDSLSGQLPVMTATTVSGILAMETSKSAADRPRINIFVVVRKGLVMMIISHIEIFPTTAAMMITHKMKASVTFVASLDSSDDCPVPSESESFITSAYSDHYL